MGKARLSSKGQITIPLDVRQKLGLQQGDWVVFKPVDGGFVLTTPSQVIADLYGSVPPLKIPWKKAREQAWRERAERIARKSSATQTSSSDS
jgi:AbrB family looped-hinge helix DNA binding protein